jgi:glutamine synthetase
MTAAPGIEADTEAGTEAQALVERLRADGIERVRIGWADLHGVLRGKTLTLAALPAALASGISMVSTIVLKDTSDRTAFKVFEPGALDGLPGFGPANNVLLRPDPASLMRLPWAPGTAWLRAEPFFEDGTPLALDPRCVLQRALARLAAFEGRGLALRCGLEVEFHVYRLEGVRGGMHADPSLDPAAAAWPGEPPRVSLLHPGYNLLAETWADRCDEVFAIVQRTCEGLGLPLASLEVELGPSQIEAVFAATDALAAADQMVLFRNGVKQALARAGWHASFVCRPPFANVMASGWHLHHSLVAADGRNAFMPAAPAPGSAPADALHWLSATGSAWLAGLLAHARGMSALATCTVNGHGRFRPGAMAPVAVRWGRDNRGAMLRVLGGAGQRATRIENRAGEPMANPYLYVAAQVLAGLDGLERGLVPPPATAAPYAGDDPPEARLPVTLAEALDALVADPVITAGLGPELTRVYTAIKRSEQARHDAAADKDEWMRREYFGRF